MLLTGVAFSQVALAVHIAAVLVAFGATFASPVILLVTERGDRRMMPWYHRIEQAIGRWLINPGLLLVLVAGIALASDEHRWKAFFVQWGLGVAIVLGGLEGAIMIPQAGKLAGMAARDVHAAAGGDVQWSPEYLKLRRRVSLVGAVMSGLVLVTVYLMTVQAT